MSASVFKINGTGAAAIATTMTVPATSTQTRNPSLRLDTDRPCHATGVTALPVLRLKAHYHGTPEAGARRSALRGEEPVRIGE